MIREGVKAAVSFFGEIGFSSCLVLEALAFFSSSVLLFLFSPQL